MKINLGGGRTKIPGYVNVDKEPLYGDVVADLEEGLPFADRSVDVINASHIFEHIHNFIPLMNECWRILKDDGFLMAAMPTYPGKMAVNDPTHVRFFTPDTFVYFVNDEYCERGTKRWEREISLETNSPVSPEIARDHTFLWILMRPKHEADTDSGG